MAHANPDPSVRASSEGNGLTRRDLVARTAVLSGAAAASPFLSPLVLTAGSPNEKLGVAVISCGGMGGGNPRAAARERCVALCDVDDGRLAKAVKEIEKTVPNPKTYFDYRKMYDECHKDMDVVLIATPDHHHAPAAIRAIHLGKAVFVQKPMAHDVAEVYALVKAAKEKKVATQMGNQGHYGEPIRRACEYIWAGAIGKVTETHTILGRNFGGSGGRPAGKPVPAGLHWDEWLGPAPHRDYHDGLHPFSWRSWRQFGTGTIGDMACHNLDCLFWALKIAEAKTYAVECLSQKGGSEEMYPQDNVIVWSVPARGDMPPVKVHVYDNKGSMPQIMKETEQKCKTQFGECTLYVGDKGLFRTKGTSGGAEILPAEKHKEFPPPPQTLPRAHGGPVGDLFWALKNNGKPCSNFPDEAGPLTAFQLTGHVAMFAGVGKKIEWDVEKMTCTNLPEANTYARREYRKGWEV
jgi:predicted dehydrogenase